MVHWNIVDYNQCSFMTIESTPVCLFWIKQRMYIYIQVIPAEVTQNNPL